MEYNEPTVARAGKTFVQVYTPKFNKEEQAARILELEQTLSGLLHCNVKIELRKGESG